MVLSNAERQKRFRERLKAAVRGDDLGERVSVAIDAAMNAVWAITHRSNWGGYEDFADVDAWKASLVDPKMQRHNGSVSDQLLSAFSGMEDEATPDEMAAIDRARSVLEAVALRHVRPTKKRAGKVPKSLIVLPTK